jgi:hypothetical protein
VACRTRLTLSHDNRSSVIPQQAAGFGLTNRRELSHFAS